LLQKYDLTWNPSFHRSGVKSVFQSEVKNLAWFETLEIEKEELVAQSLGTAIIGLGRKWAWQLGAAARRSNSLNLLSCYARTPKTRQDFASEFECHPANSLGGALSTPGVKAVIISTPAHTHFEIARACVERDLHVFIEKPMTLTLGEAIEMKKLFESAGLVLMVNHEMRRLGSTRAMRQVIKDGRLGSVAAASASITLPGSFHPQSWRFHRETNRGGALMQLGIHQIDNLIFLFGKVATVQGFVAHRATQVALDDTGIAQLRFESGVLGTVVSTFISPKSYAIKVFGNQANLDCVIDMQVWPDVLQVHHRTLLTLETKNSRQNLPIEPRDFLVEALDEFAASVSGKSQPETGAETGLAALAVVEAALISAQTGKIVNPQELIQSEREVLT
jgi:UDP-N-acetyl-2-amino-2-deoxyglucuronate dehydrogenase